jgi:putative DNA primase/helicase
MNRKLDTFEDHYNLYTSLGFRAVKCRGYSEGNTATSDIERYRQAKAAVNKGYTDDSYEGLNIETCLHWMSFNAWLGWVIPKGYIAIDADNPEIIDNIFNLIKEKNLKCWCHKTTNGYHFIFRLNTALSADSGATTRLGKATYKVGGKSYLILAPIEDRRWVHIDADNKPDFLPEELMPVEQADNNGSSQQRDWDEIYKGTDEGNRTSSLVSMLGSWIRDKVKEETAVHFALAWNSRNRPPLPDDTVMFTVKDMYKRYYEESQQADLLFNFHNTDVGNGGRFAFLYRGRLKYCQKIKAWYEWSGTHWKEVDERIFEYAKDTIRTLEDVLMQQRDNMSEELRATYRNFISKSESVHSLNDMILCAKSEEGILHNPEDFDDHRTINLLNVRNGIIKLKTKELLPHDKDLGFTKIVDINYNPDAKNERWLKFLSEIFSNNQEYIDYVQKALGCSITGEIVGRYFFNLEGTGYNGKSTFIDIVSRIFGPYAISVSTETWNKKKNSDGSSASPDVARLKGMRFVYSSENDRKVVLNTALIKQITGGEKITARFLHKENFDFYPQFRIWYSGNKKPLIVDTSDGIWDRVKLIKFYNQFLEGVNADKHLAEKLFNEEKEGILAWVVEGSYKYHQEGLITPECIKQSVEEYRTESSVVSLFIQDECVVDRDVKIKRKDLYSAFKLYCDDNRYESFSNRMFNEEMRQKGYKEHASDGDLFWLGITLCSKSMGSDANKTIEELLGYK